ncbi:MAG: CapA family protein [Oscillospiraceae bacterium]|nr:CapA family protein [Oscillospiraceae bacterium]
MKQVGKGFLGVLLAVLLVVLTYIVYLNVRETNQMEAEAEYVEATPKPVIESAAPSKDPGPIQEGENNADIKIAVYGDIVCHTGLNDEAKKSDGSYDYSPIFSDAMGPAQEADYSIVTLETTFPNSSSYSGYPMFSSPASLATGLKQSGFDLVNTASNHSMDSYQSGLNRTLDVLDENGLDHIGTYRSQEERDAANGIVAKDINGVSVAFLSYTYGTNGMPITGFEYAVNVFNNDYLTDLTDVKYDMMKTDMAAARAMNTDLIIVLMHWGTEYELTPNNRQRELADFLFAEGADIVLGGHTHVPEPMELRRVTDNEGNEKTGYIVYSLGNFISCQNDRFTNLTAAVTLTIRKNLNTGETYLKSVSYKPMFMVDLSDHGISGAGWRYRLWDLRKAIGSYEAGDNYGVITETLYNALTAGLSDLHTVLDPTFDEANGGVDVVNYQFEDDN